MVSYHWPIARLIAFILFVICAVYAIVADPPEVDVLFALLASGCAAYTAS